MDKVSAKPDCEALQDKMRSYHTLNSLYHESGQEIELLHKQIVVKDNIISELKGRLGRYEGLHMRLGDSELLRIGPSKSLLESLCKEICKLKQKRNDVDFKASRQAEEIQRLTMQLQEKERELDSLRICPEHEKDQEIHRLRSALEERKRAEATRVVLCTSLAEEAEQLRNQLGATVNVCQELLSRLERGEKAGEQTSEASDISSVNCQIRQLQEENKQLKQRVDYVQGLNSQWQKYDSSREDYIRGLCQRLKETSGQGLIPGLGPGVLHQEISRLNGLLQEKMSECEQLNRELEKRRWRDQERIQTLEQQVLIYTEDFKSERADRERAQGQIEDLKDQVNQLKRQLHKQQGVSRESRDIVPMCRMHIGHRMSSRRHRDSSEPLLRTNTEMQQQPAASPAAAAASSSGPAWNTSAGPSELECPRCFAIFSDRDFAEYLNHCEECAKL